MSWLATEMGRRLRRVSDPLMIRASTAEILLDARFVRLVPEGIRRASTLVGNNIKTNRLLTEHQFGKRRVESQRVFLQDVINFCFWARKGQKRWEVEYPAGKRFNGWYALTACFERALAEGVPVLDAKFLASLALDDTRHILRGTNGVTIPFLEARHHFLKKAGATLVKHWGGSVDYFLKEHTHDAAAIATAIIHHFPSFQDQARIEGKRVMFYKRAQICAYDLSLLSRSPVRNTEALTAFADYKLPQLLRHMGALTYQRQLATGIDGYALIPQGSRQEVEIRAATIWVCEIIAEELSVPAVLVDNALWLAATTNKYTMKPYHRTLTTNY